VCNFRNSSSTAGVKPIIEFLKLFARLFFYFFYFFSKTSNYFTFSRLFNAYHHFVHTLLTILTLFSIFWKENALSILKIFFWKIFFLMKFQNRLAFFIRFSTSNAIYLSFASIS